MDDDGFQLNLSFDDGPKNQKLGWKERKSLQAAKRKSGQRPGGAGRGPGSGSFINRGSSSGGGGSGARPAAGAPQQQRVERAAPKEGGVPGALKPPPQQQQQQQRPRPGTANGVANGAGPKRPQQQQQQQQQQQERTGRPQERPQQQGRQQQAGQGRQQQKRPQRDESPDWARGAEEDGDLASLVAMAMTREKVLAEEMGPSGRGAGDSSDDDDGGGGGGRPRGGGGGFGGGGLGVVEFGDAADEPDWGRTACSGGGGGGGRDGGGKHQQQKKQAAKGGGGGGGGAGMLAHKVGELARAGAAVPQDQRRVIFGDAGDADDAPADWEGLGLCPTLAAHLVAMNFSEPTKVQRAALPPLLAGRDAMVRAPTGSGKTLAYLAPIVERLQAASPRITRAEGTHAIVLSPTRELAVQISDVLVALCRRFNWLVPGVLIGGEHRGHEKARLRKGVTVLVATPGRLLDHLQNTAAFRTDALAWLVLDEADRLLDLGFEAKIREIISAVEARAAALEDHSGGGPGRASAPGARYGDGAAPPRQTVLLSATLPPALGAFARALMRPGPVAVGFSAAQLNDPSAAAGDTGDAAGDAGDAAPQEEQFEIPSQLRQSFVEVPARLRLVALVAALRARLLRRGAVSSDSPAAKAKIVVFFSNCDSVEYHHALLTRCSGGGGGSSGSAHGGRGSGDSDGEGGPQDGVSGLLPAPPLKLHGDMPQAERTSNMLRFAQAATGVLLCTDVAARGLDFPSVTAILQYDPAGEPAEYVHRVGRTARLGQGGEALMLLLPSERGYVELMSARGVSLKEDSLPGLLRALPPVAPAGKPWRRGGFFGDGDDPRGPEALPEVQTLQRRLVGAVGADPQLKAMAADAFRSFLRAYAVHPSHLKPIFRVRGLHLGHIAASFALAEPPGAIGGSGSAKERKRRKAEAQREEAAKKRKKMRSSAAAALAGGR